MSMRSLATTGLGVAACSLVLGACLHHGETSEYPMNADGGASQSSDMGGTPHATAGTLTVLAAGQTSPFVLAIDRTSVYWANWGTGSANSGSVMKVGLDGGPVTTLADAQYSPGGIAVDATGVYWSSNGEVQKVPLAGGTATVVATGFINDDIAVGPSGVYGTDTTDAPVSAPLSGDGGAATRLAPGLGNSNTYGIAVYGPNLYWTEFSNTDEVLKVSLSGGEPTVLAKGQVPFGVAVDEKNVYWIDGGNTPSGGRVMKVSVDGSYAVTLASGIADPTGIAIDATNAYVTTGFHSDGPGSILRVPLAGGQVTTLATGLSGPAGIAVDTTSVYWTNLGGEEKGAGTIMKLTPK
jgi:hypothetical protein